MSRIAPLRSLTRLTTRQLAHNNVSSIVRPAMVASQTRGYKRNPQPMRDVMTGEIIQTPDLDASLMKITKTTSPKTPLPPSKLVFGKTFTDHMLTVNWNSANGWGTPEIKPYAPLELDPSSTVFHYAFTLFEGMKAYRQEDGTVRLFRPDMNMARMNRSAARIALPTFDGEALIELIKKLVVLDSEWIPKEPGYSLYIRPTLIGTQNALGVGPSSDAMLFVICSPVGPYYASGFKPVQLLATTKFVRAAPGGTGGYKLGANYAPGVVPQAEAAKEGYSQNLWLLGEEHALTEVGTMNLFVAFKKPDGTVELVTPPLDDVVLPGVTRDSALALARAHANGDKIPGLPENLVVSERKLIMADLVEAEKNGTLVEVFGTGTAAIVSAVDKIGYEGRDIEIPTGPDGLGSIAKGLLDRMTAIQIGEIEHPWSVIANPVKSV
ncbi:branched-chain amino acid aminotransferase [Kwoniella mangroviensis CBS 10435]|uniref:Branched-chain-amino-acid aminotransferase n=1 Tax=Kwoniella mangroviensis CBS 10435 TaxID=1331196 RepID=A0A1B9IN25_9TREE|nr:branched-chain amino acid aminotransferase [Kwoniella mangroviensis CBS 8507]OCF56770.1 branched-chain amino acid aminotransferase [Kwoniella mangroviensis CBS 10435]OCF63575.1 branched-chain amino acid aminotransferase [Kwoniella mangroviensis CBS 8507]OCF75342.1 branched-chain amino acid aminotransferase [Kwoniella mangroviensis CBS 8886]